MTKKSAAGLSVFALTMLITGSIDSIRNLPATALFGSTLIFFFIFAAIVFLIPTGLVSAELASSWPEKGGIYHWVELAFGKKIGFLAIWLQWINTMVWYPTILSFIAGTFAYLINPGLAENKEYLVLMILATFWILTLINLRGIQASARVASFCAIFGMIIPMTLIIGMGGLWVFLGNPTHLHITLHNAFPHLAHSGSWVSLTAIMTAFVGMELATVHVSSVKDAQTGFPRSLLFSTIFILVTMILGALAIAFVLPADQISLVNGVMEAFINFFESYHMGWMIPVVTLMLLIGSLGGMINWIISPAKGLLQAAEENYLPAIFQKKNKHGVAGNLLISQAVLVSILCAAFLLMPSVNGSYWLLTDLSTELYMLMYLLMFATAIRLRYKFADHQRAFRVPGPGNSGMWITCLLGFLGCLVTVFVGFFPPSAIDVGGAAHYETLFISGILAMILPVFLFYYYKSWHDKQ